MCYEGDDYDLQRKLQWTSWFNTKLGGILELDLTWKILMSFMSPKVDTGSECDQNIYGLYMMEQKGWLTTNQYAWMKHQLSMVRPQACGRSE